MYNTGVPYDDYTHLVELTEFLKLRRCCSNMRIESTCILLIYKS
jgi:hypothetical protein